MERMNCMVCHWTVRMGLLAEVCFLPGEVEEYSIVEVVAEKIVDLQVREHIGYWVAGLLEGCCMAIDLGKLWKVERGDCTTGLENLPEECNCLWTVTKVSRADDERSGVVPRSMAN